MKASVIGSGTWGTALSIILSHNGHDVTLYSRLQSEIDEILKEKRHKNLPGAVIPDSLCGTAKLEEALKDKDLIVLAVPSIYIRATAERMKPFIRQNQVIVSCAKGIEEDSLLTMTDIIEEVLPQADVGVLSGPSHAEEVSRFI
ncbi:MAG: 2-dehydropantoate 2-reductase N-terminal domain-containing protein, partial [Oribacterium sp.]|nr:2-dehydropantoate 2-reductase N-terminal domain-containing protein [Oribacterium sp.]